MDRNSPARFDICDAAMLAFSRGHRLLFRFQARYAAWRLQQSAGNSTLMRWSRKNSQQ